uniref:Sushi domain-containing protein n=1 Tax=Meleagris gallopavo TaxID=9103 RepID=A0A803Y726_MELGA
STPSHYIYRPGDVVRFTCNTGYNLQALWALLLCTRKMWPCTDNHIHVPTAIGCQSPTVHNGKVQALKDTFEAGETLRFDCDAGYAAEGSHRARCQPGGSWDPPVLSCERVQPCPMPPKISNGDHDGHGRAEFTMGMHVTYTCNLGYYLAGNVERVFCKATGKWSQPMTCPPPPNIANGLHSSRSSARFPHGTVVYYSCKDGFELVGNVSISCLDVGRWSRPLPRCQGGWRQPCGHCCSVPAGCGPALTTISMFLQPSAARVPQCTMGRCRH